MKIILCPHPVVYCVLTVHFILLGETKVCSLQLYISCWHWCLFQMQLY